MMRTINRFARRAWVQLVSGVLWLVFGIGGLAAFASAGSASRWFQLVPDILCLVIGVLSLRYAVRTRARNRVQAN